MATLDTILGIEPVGHLDREQSPQREETNHADDDLLDQLRDPGYGEFARFESGTLDAQNQYASSKVSSTGSYLEVLRSKIIR
jgi:hypothetical protein